jgi:hypothetical protein
MVEGIRFNGISPERRVAFLGNYSAWQEHNHFMGNVDYGDSHYRSLLSEADLIPLALRQMQIDGSTSLMPAVLARIDQRVIELGTPRAERLPQLLQWGTINKVI